MRRYLYNLTTGAAGTLCRSLWRVLVVAAALASIAQMPAHAQQYPPSSGELQLSTGAASPGEPVTVAGSGYAPESDVVISFESTPVVLAVVRTDSSGAFSTQVRIPLDATPGMHTLRATGVDGEGRTRVLTAMIHVIGFAAGRSTVGESAAATPAAPQTGGTPTARAPSRSHGFALTGSTRVRVLIVTATALLIMGFLILLRARASRTERGR